MKGKNIKILVGLMILIICIIAWQSKVLGITEDEYINGLKHREPACFTNSKGEDITEAVKSRAKTQISNYVKLYNEYEQFMGGNSYRTTATDFIKSQNLMCISYGQGVGFDVGESYEKKQQEVRDMALNITDSTRITYLKKIIELDTLNLQQSIFYEMGTITVNNGEVTMPSGCDLTKDQIIELIYAMSNGLGSKKVYTPNTISEYKSHSPWSDDTNSQTVWGIRGSVTRNTQAEEAKKYREDINELKGEHKTGPVKGEKDGNTIKATVMSPINFKSEILKDVNESGATFNPTLKGNVGKGDNVEIKIPYEEGKNE